MPDDAPIPFEGLALQPGEMLQVHSALEVTGDFLPVGLLGAVMVVSRAVPWAFERLRRESGRARTSDSP